jgi:hypothetical protein
LETTLNFQKEKRISSDFDDATKGKALYKVVFGILKEWDLSQEELALLLNRTPTTISEWKKREFISISKNPDMNAYQIFEFIELYKGLTNLFVSVKDRVAWLREINEGLNNTSPLQLIQEDPRNLHSIRNLLSRLANP